MSEATLIQESVVPAHPDSDAGRNRHTSTPSWKYAAFLLLVSVVVYAQALAFPFLQYDDVIYIQENAYVHQWKSAPSFFSSFVNENFDKSSAKLPNLYRPAISCWILLNYKLFGERAALWHLMAVALYALGVLLLWRIAWKLSCNQFVAVACALLYAVHPLHVEAVAWIAGAYVETLLTVFFFGAFLAYLRWRESRRPIWLVMCGVLTLCALLSKESAAALPVLIACHVLIFRGPREKPEPGGRGLLPVGIALCCSVVIYALMRFHAIHGIVAPHRLHSWTSVFRSIPLVFVTHLKHAFWPVHLSAWYDERLVSKITLGNFYVPLLICVAYSALMIWALRRKPVAGFMMLWWALSLVPTLLGTISLSEDLPIVQDRFAFLGLAGLCLVVAQVLESIPSRVTLLSFKAPGTIAVAIMAAVMGGLSALQVNTWRDDFALARHGIEVAPHTLRPWILLGVESSRKRDFDTAVVAFRGAVDVAPDQWNVLYTYAIALKNVGDRKQAIRVLTRGLELNPTATPTYIVLANLLTAEGRLDEADKVLEQGIAQAREPDFLRLLQQRLRTYQARSIAR